LSWLRASPVSWLGVDSLRTKWIRAQQACGLPAEKKHCSGAQAKSSPYSRAAATALHRLPEHEVRG